MTHPLANPKSSDRDALLELGEIRGFQLFEKRLQEELIRSIRELQFAAGLQEAGRCQGFCLALEHIARLRELMIGELNEEIENASKPEQRSIYEIFYGKQ